MIEKTRLIKDTDQYLSKQGLSTDSNIVHVILKDIFYLS